MQITDCSDYPREMLRLFGPEGTGVRARRYLDAGDIGNVRDTFVFRELLGHEKRHDGVVTLHHRLIGRVTFADGKSRQGFVRWAVLGMNLGLDERQSVMADGFAVNLLLCQIGREAAGVDGDE